MRNMDLELEQFNGILATRREYLMARPKHLGKFQARKTWFSENPLEENSAVSFPISAEVLIVRKHEGEPGRSFSIEKVQNGRSSIICESIYDDSALSDSEFFQEFEATLDSFKQKGFAVV